MLAPYYIVRFTEILYGYRYMKWAKSFSEFNIYTHDFKPYPAKIWAGIEVVLLVVG